MEAGKWCCRYCFTTHLPSLWWAGVTQKAFIHANEQSLCVHNTTRASLTCIVGQSSVVHVKEEPSLLPCLYSSPSFGQEACTASRCQPQVHAAGHPVTQRLHMGPKVEVWREEERLATLLKRYMVFKCDFLFSISSFSVFKSSCTCVQMSVCLLFTDSKHWTLCIKWVCCAKTWLMKPSEWEVYKSLIQVQLPVNTIFSGPLTLPYVISYIPQVSVGVEN